MKSGMFVNCKRNNVSVKIAVGLCRRGWPETANTWEPLENLQSVSDVIDAFEER